MLLRWSVLKNKSWTESRRFLASHRLNSHSFRDMLLSMSNKAELCSTGWLKLLAILLTNLLFFGSMEVSLVTYLLFSCQTCATWCTVDEFDDISALILHLNLFAISAFARNVCMISICIIVLSSRVEKKWIELRLLLAK